MKYLCVFTVLILCCVNSFAADKLNYPIKRGDYITSGTTPGNEYFEWLKKFNIIEIGGVGDTLDRDKIVELKKAGVKRILCYDWMPAVYYYLEGDNLPFVNWLYQNRYETTINPDGPFPHTEEMGYDFARDYYLDWGNQTVISKRSDFIIDFVLSNLYNGIFWDWGPGIFINEPEYSGMKNYFNSKHPDKDYLKSVGDFYSYLQENLKSKNLIMVTNQGYRNAENVLPYTNYDLAESYITDYGYYGKVLNVKGYGEIEIPETIYFPVSEGGEESFADTLYYLDYISSLIEQYAGKNFKNFIYLDYAAPEFVKDDESGEYVAQTPLDAIFLSFATAKLSNRMSYLEVSFDPFLGKSDVYFVDLGKPYGNTYAIDNENKTAIRFYSNGFVFVYFGDDERKDIVVESQYIPKNVNYCNVYNKQWSKANNNTITVHIKTRKDPLSGKTIPAGRVIMYEKNYKIIIPIIPKKLKNNLSQF